MFARFLKKTRSAEPLPHNYPPVLKEETRGNDPAYSTWVRNQRWTRRNENWSLRQIERFEYRPTIAILIQSKNPNVTFLRESLSSIFNQVYPFHELFIVDRGSSDPEVKRIIDEASADARTKISFQKGSQREAEAIAKIMKKVTSEWLLLMGSEDILAPNALYNMIAVLQTNLDADFVYSDSDLIDEQGLRFDPQFKPIWAVGAHYPLGYYQHPVLLNDRLVAKLKGHERVSAFMEEGSLLDEASNHSRWVAQAPGMLYHARAKGLKNEKPPQPVYNVFLNENLSYKNAQIRIDEEIRSRAEPGVPLRILWLVDSLDLEDGAIFQWNLANYLKNHFAYQFVTVASKNGPLEKLYERFSAVQILAPEDPELNDWIQATHEEFQFDVAYVSSGCLPQILSEVQVPVVVTQYQSETISEKLSQAATVLFPWDREKENSKLKSISRILYPGIAMEDIKLYKQQTSPLDVKAKLGLPKSATIVSIFGPTVESKGQSTFVQAAMELLQRNPGIEVHFFIVGERSGPYLEMIKDFIQKTDYETFFHFVPEAAEPSENYPYYWISDICVSCSKEEIFPIAVLEAMAFKKAIIATRRFANTEVLEEDGNGYLVDFGNVQDLSSRLQDLVLKKDLTEAFGRRSLEIVMERFTLQKTAKALQNFLRESIVYE
jgi:glycosyltransferase involved in cell wall biosynthesis